MGMRDDKPFLPESQRTQRHIYDRDQWRVLAVPGVLLGVVVVLCLAALIFCTTRARAQSDPPRVNAITSALL